MVAFSLIFVGTMYYRKAKIADSDAMVIGIKFEEEVRKKISPIQTNSSFTGDVALEIFVNVKISRGEIEEIGEIEIKEVRFQC